MLLRLTIPRSGDADYEAPRGGLIALGLDEREPIEGAFNVLDHAWHGP
jgi:hypothetical protein